MTKAPSWAYHGSLLSDRSIQCPAGYPWPGWAALTLATVCRRIPRRRRGRCVRIVDRRLHRKFHEVAHLRILGHLRVDDVDRSSEPSARLEVADEVRDTGQRGGRTGDGENVGGLGE